MHRRGWLISVYIANTSATSAPYNFKPGAHPSSESRSSNSWTLASARAPTPVKPLFPLGLMALSAQKLSVMNEKRVRITACLPVSFSNHYSLPLFAILINLTPSRYSILLSDLSVIFRHFYNFLPFSSSSFSFFTRIFSSRTITIIKLN